MRCSLVMILSVYSKKSFGVCFTLQRYNKKCTYARKYVQNLHIQKKHSTFVPSNCSSLMKYRFADILIDSSAHCVMRRAQVVRLTNIEFRLLEYLAQNADHICSREDILNHVWGQQFQYDTGTRGWFPKNPKRK